MSEATARSRRLRSLPHLPRMEDEVRSWEMSWAQTVERGNAPKRHHPCAVGSWTKLLKFQRWDQTGLLLRPVSAAFPMFSSKQ